MAKLFTVIVVALTAWLFCLSINSQPRTGLITGICRDKATGAPIDGATVDIDISQITDDSQYQSNEEDTSRLPDQFAIVPTGWTQGSQADTGLDIAGHKSVNKTHWETTTDDQGRFLFRSVTVGSYTVTASSSGHTNEGTPLAVAEGANEPLTITMTSDGESLNFDSPGRYWTTDEYPSLGLRGLLPHLKIRYELEQLDTDSAIHKSPYLLMQDEQTPDTTNVKSIVLRSWSDEIKDADDEGAFYDQVHCFDPTTGKHKPGIYRITASSETKGGPSCTAIFDVTDIAVTVKTYRTSALLHAVDIRTGKSLSGVKASCVNSDSGPGSLLSTATTNADGLCTLSTKGAQSESQAALIIRSGPNFAGAQINVNSPGSVDDDSGTSTSQDPYGKDLRAFINTDRPVYRPGQLVQIKGISRWYMMQKGFTVPSNQPVDITITDAQNTIVNRQKVTTNKFGSWTGSFTLSTEALTGQYTIQESIGGTTETGLFAVAAYHKPQYYVTVTYDKSRYIKGDKIVATVTGTYYFGAPMSGASGNVEIYKTESEPGDDVVVGDGDDGDGAVSGTFVDSKDVVLDGNGQAKITVDTSDKSDNKSSDDSDSTAKDTSDTTDIYASQMTYTANATISDESDSPVTSEASVVVAQGDFSINSTASSTIANVGDPVTITADVTDQKNRPITGKALALVASYDVWQDNQDVQKAFASATLTTGSDGSASYVIRPSKAGLINATLTAKDDRGNTVTSQVQIWIPDTKSDIEAQYSDMSILLDKTKYQPGDTARVLITTAHPGPDALVTVEGTTLYKSMIVPLTRRATAIDIPVAEAYAPGVTVAVNCIVAKQYLSSSANLQIDDPQRKLVIGITPDKSKYHPGDTATVKVHTSNQAGKPVSADLSLAIVDSAVFAIMPEQNGTISDAFLPAQSNLVGSAYSTSTIYYGDVDKGSTNIDIRRKFPDTALWQPDIVTNNSGDAQVSLKLPDTLTTWRITAYGQTLSTMVGKGTGLMVVNKDLTVHLEGPNFLVDGDSSTLLAMVHNNTDRPLDVKFRLLPGKLGVTGDLQQQIVVQPDSPTKLTWLITAHVSGTYAIDATVQSGSLNDGVETTLDVQPHGETYATWDAGTALHHAFLSLKLSPGALKRDSQLTIRLSPTLASALPPAADYLSSYPFGDMYTTADVLTADSTLYLARGALNLPADVQADIKQKAERALLRTYRQQQDDGGWGWFPVDKSDIFSTASATWGLTVAKQSGLNVTPSILKAALKATSDDCDLELKKHIFSNVNTTMLATGALCLAENGHGDSAKRSLDFLIRHWTAAPTQSYTEDRSIAAIAEQAIHTPESLEEAEQLVASLWSVSRDTGAMTSWTWEYHSSAQYAGEYPPDSGSTAWALLAAETVTPTDPRVDKAARWLLANRNDDHWADVDDTAISVMALAKYLGNTKEMTPNMTVTVKVNGKTAGVTTFTTSSIGDADTVIVIPGSHLLSGDNDIELSKSGTGRLYYSVKLSQCLKIAAPKPPDAWILTEFDHLLHPPKLPATSSGYRIKRIYMRLTTRRNFLWEDTVPAPDWQFDEGDSILARLIIDSTRPGSRIAITEPVPPGCRIAETSGEFDENWDNWWDYTDVRDSNIVFFVNDLTTGRHEIDYHLVANRAGDYDVMPTSITSMVDPSLQAVGSATKVNVDGN